MSKLGYTWYPKDFASDPDVMLMTASERGIYRDLIDLAYQTNNCIRYSIEALSRYTNGDIKDIKAVLKQKGVNNGDFWTIPSCNKRLKIAERNQKNGSKPKGSQIEAKDEAKDEEYMSQTARQREREDKREGEVKDEDEKKNKELPSSSPPESKEPELPPIQVPEFLGANHAGAANFGDITATEMYLSSPVEDCAARYTESMYFQKSREEVAMRHHIDEEILKDWSDVFVRFLTGKGELKKTLKDFASHFSNWMPKQDFTKTPKQALEYEQRNSNTREKGTKSRRASPQSFYNQVKSTGNNQ